jgi:probable rRNA maturation factor
MISFQAEGVKFPIVKRQTYKIWLKTVAQHHQKIIGELNYLFLSDDGLLEYNQSYLNHDTYTDIITFDTSEDENKLEGDIVISVDRVRENAEKFDVTFDIELRRVMAHGVLHLCGFRDKTESDITAIREAENLALTLFPDQP